MKTIRELLSLGPLLVGEIRSVKIEEGKRMDKSDKDAPPLTFNVGKILLEQIAVGECVMLTVYFDNGGADASEWLQTAGLKRDCVVGVVVRKTELRKSVRLASCGRSDIYLLGAADIAWLRRGQD